MQASPSLASSTIGVDAGRFKASEPPRISPSSPHAFPDQHGRHMGKRCEIAGRANRTLCGDNRHDAGSKQAWISSINCQRTPDAPRPSDSIFSAIISRTMPCRHRRADTAAMRQDEIALQCSGIVGGNADACELSEAGIDAIDRFLSARRVANTAAGAILAAAGRQDRSPLPVRPVHCLELCQRDRAGRKNRHAHAQASDDAR